LHIIPIGTAGVPADYCSNTRFPKPVQRLYGELPNLVRAHQSLDFFRFGLREAVVAQPAPSRIGIRGGFHGLLQDTIAST
jgi:hypothetical protein